MAGIWSRPYSAMPIIAAKDLQALGGGGGGGGMPCGLASSSEVRQCMAAHASFRKSAPDPLEPVTEGRGERLMFHLFCFIISKKKILRLQ